MKAHYQELQNQDAARRRQRTTSARLSFREANEIINTAQKNADVIIREALATARGILEDLSVLCRIGRLGQGRSQPETENLLKDLDDFRLPEMPDLMWLKEAERKLR